MVTRHGEMTSRWDRAIDLFGHFIVAEPRTLWESKLLQDAATDWWDTIATGAGASGAWANSVYTLSVSNLTAGSFTRQSIQRMPYQAGKAGMTKITACMGAATTGITREWELSDGSNGIGFKQTPTGLVLFERNGGSETFSLARASWDNPAPWLDETKTQIWFTIYAWLGVGPVVWGVFHNGVPTILHTRTHEGLLTAPYMVTPVLPVRFKITNDGTGPAATLTQICVAHESLGGREFTGQPRFIDRGVTGQTVSGQTLTPLLSIRLGSGTKRYVTTVPTGVSIITTTTSEYRWALIRNATLTTPSWVAMSAGPIEYDVTALTMSGGSPSEGNYDMQSNTAALTLPINNHRWLGEMVSTGAAETLTLAVQRLSAAGSDTFYGKINWLEAA